MAFIFLVITMSISCSQKGIFLPKESVYFSINDTVHSYRSGTYPFKLTDKPPFKEAVYRDATELFRLMGLFNVYCSRMQKTTKDKDEYFIISCDDKYIYYGFLKESNGELYAKYNPLKEEDKDMHPVIRTKKEQNLDYWVIRELNKGSTVSIIGDKEGTYIGKSFKE